MDEQRKRTHTFAIDHVGEDTGKRYEGRFTTKKMTIRMWQDHSIRKTELNGGYCVVRDADGVPTGKGIDPETDYLNSVWAHCEIALFQKPEWFDRDRVEDWSVILEVYKEVIEFENSFRNRGNGLDGSRQEGGTPESSGSDGSDPLLGALVEPEVPTIVQKR